MATIEVQTSKTTKYIEGQGWEDGKTRYLFTKWDLYKMLIAVAIIGFLMGGWIGLAVGFQH